MVRPTLTVAGFMTFLILPASQRLCGELLHADTTKSVSKDSTTKKEEKWDVAAPHGPSKDIEFDTDEGTWISVDV
ncbi:MAG: hypothetical protein AAB393_02945, partial [Bacteroidota bacterium]